MKKKAYYSYRKIGLSLALAAEAIIGSIAPAAEVFSGSVSSFPTYISHPDTSNESLVLNNLRGRYFSSTTRSGNFEIAYELSPIIWLSQPVHDPSVAISRYRAGDLEGHVNVGWGKADDQRFKLYQNLDRLNLDHRFALVDLSIGRQAIAFGCGKGVSPNDTVLPFSLIAIDKEDRRGVDAIRGKLFLSNLSEIDFGVIFGKDFREDNGAYFIRPKFNLLKTDITISALKFLTNQVWGLELQAPIYQASGWVDATLTEPEHTDSFMRLSIGVDYSFQGEFYAALEYHYNGTGSTTVRDYFSHAAKSQPYRDEYVFLLARNYLIPILGYFITPLVTANGIFYFNLDDRSILNALRLDYNISENYYLAAGGSWGTSSGKDGDEFKLYPKTSYGSLRYYF